MMNADLSSLTELQRREVIALVKAMESDTSLSMNNVISRLKGFYYDGPFSVKSFEKWSFNFCRTRADKDRLSVSD